MSIHRRDRGNIEVFLAQICGQDNELPELQPEFGEYVLLASLLSIQYFLGWGSTVNRIKVCEDWKQQAKPGFLKREPQCKVFGDIADSTACFVGGGTSCAAPPPSFQHILAEMSSKTPTLL